MNLLGPYLPQWMSSVRLRSVSDATTTAASTATSCVTLSMTVATALTRDRRTVSNAEKKEVAMLIFYNCILNITQCILTILC